MRRRERLNRIEDVERERKIERRGTYIASISSAYLGN